MSYLRPARIEEIREFLVRNEDLDADQMATALADRFDVLTLSTTAQ